MANNRSLGSLFIDVDLRTQRLERGMNRLTDRAKQFAVSLAGFFSIREIGRFVQETGEWAKALQDSANNLGLTVEQMQGLQQAAQLAGQPIQQIEVAIQRLTRRAAEARQGVGEALGAFEDIGLLQQLQSGELTGTTAVFDAVIDRVRTVGDELERNRLLFKFFDSEGVRAINALIQEMESLESVTEQFNTVSGQNVDALAQLRDQGVRAWLSIKNAILEATGVLGSFLLEAQGGIAVDLNAETDELILKQEELGDKLEEQRSRLDNIRASIQNAYKLDEIQALIVLEQQAINQTENLEAAIARIGDQLAFRQAAEEAEELERATGAAAAAAKKASLDLLEMNVAFLEIEESMGIFQEDLGRLPEQLSEVGEESGRVGSRVESAAQGIASSWGSAVSQMVTDSDRSFGEILQSFSRMITQMLIQQAVSGLFGAVLGPVGATIGGAFAGSFGGTAAPAGGSVNVFSSPGTEVTPVANAGGSTDLYVENTIVKSITSRGPAGQAIERTYGAPNPGRPGGSF